MGLKKTIKCPFCGAVLNTKRKNCRKSTLQNDRYFTRCNECKTDVLISVEDLEFDTVE